MSAVTARCGPGVYWSEWRIIDAALAWADLHGAPPKAEQWRFAGENHPNVCTVQAHFGSWRTMLEQAGLPPRANGCPVYWTRERVIAKIRCFAAEHGRAPKSREMRAEAGLPHFSTVRALFGNHGLALNAAGYECPAAAPPRRWTRDLVAAAMLDELFRTGRWPHGRAWAAPKKPGENRPSTGTVLALFGTWNAAKRFAGWTQDPEPPVAAEPTWACASCGTDDPDNCTLGCHTCKERVKRRGLRQRGPALSPRAENRDGGAATLHKQTGQRNSQSATVRSDAQEVSA